MPENIKNIYSEDAVIQNLITEIKALEEQLKIGDRPKMKGALLGGITGALVGGACVLAAPIVLPSLAIGLTAGVSGGLSLSVLGAGGGYALTKGKKEVELRLKEKTPNLISTQTKLIENAAPGKRMNFIFNLDSPLYPKYQRKTEEQVKDEINDRKQNNANPFLKKKEGVQPLNMADHITGLNKVFMDLFKQSADKRPIIETIEIKNAELNDSQLKELLVFGLGCAGTKNLDLSKNRLTYVATQKLKACIVNKKQSLHDLKKLDLSDNNLTEDALDDIKEIVRHLGIEELNISGNKLNGWMRDENYISPKLKDFLLYQSHYMPTLKVLKLSNIGLTDNFSRILGDMIEKPSILSHLDITHNPDLGQAKLCRLLEKGFQLNQSLNELLVDQRDNLGVDELINTKNKQYLSMREKRSQPGEINEPRVVYLINCFYQSKLLNEDPRGFLAPELHEMIDTVVEKIQTVRKRIFEIEDDYSILVTEKEFVKIMNKELNFFYMDVIRGKDKTVLNEKLFINAERMAVLRGLSDTVYEIQNDKLEKLRAMKREDRFKPSLKQVV